LTTPLGRQRTSFRYGSLLVLLFFFTAPLVNPWVRGDGVGYYAYARSLLIDHDLRFEEEWQAANPSFRLGRVDSNNQLRADQYTSTGHVANHFSVGPAMLWAPFLLVIHLVVLGVNKLGAHIPADGYSWPYLIIMALATATYGFLGLYLSFRLARKYYEECWAFLATLGIWFATSLPVYMYFNPSWSHAHSAFAASLFLFYWHRTRGQRSAKEWALLGACSGLMIEVYYPNAVFLLFLVLEASAAYWFALGRKGAAVGRLLAGHALYCLVGLIVFLPTLITRKIIYGRTLEFGYGEKWFWTAPALKNVMFSANHGLLSWTPILIFAVLGLYLFRKADRQLAVYLGVVFLVFTYLIGSYEDWHGISSFGNRFFVSLTPVFVLGLTASVAAFAGLFERKERALTAVGLLTGMFVLWNAGLMFQWGTHMIPARGPISWRKMAYQQVAVVPVRVTHTLETYLVRRKFLMERIEQQDLKQLQSDSPEGE
jgi:hypothetical protein